MSPTRLFIYGTLKRGGSNHHYMSGQTFITEARTTPAFRLHDFGGFPGMVRAEDGLSIEGELWDVDADCLARLDVLEGIDVGEYERVPASLLLSPDTANVQVYLWRGSVAGRPDLGTRWVERR